MYAALTNATVSWLGRDPAGLVAGYAETTIAEKIKAYFAECNTLMLFDVNVPNYTPVTVEFIYWGVHCTEDRDVYYFRCKTGDVCFEYDTIDRHRDMPALVASGGVIQKFGRPAHGYEDLDRAVCAAIIARLEAAELTRFKERTMQVSPKVEWSLGIHYVPC